MVCIFHAFSTVVFHVVTLMPNRADDPNRNNKKLHIGNDYVTIVYNDSGEEYQMGTIKVGDNLALNLSFVLRLITGLCCNDQVLFQGQFNYVNVVITPLDHGFNAVTVQSKQGEYIVYL